MEPVAAERVAVWGVLNVTHDSFSDGGRYLEPGPALAHAERMAAEGADVIDVGGESSRPAGRTYGTGGFGVSAEDERARVVPVVAGLVERGVAVSIDTVKGEVARAALEAGARIVNDVSGGRDQALLAAAAEHHAELVLMHTRGRGERDGVRYDDVVGEVLDELRAMVERAAAVGVATDRIWIDPGIGFAKKAAESVALLGALDRFVATGHRVLVGASRKSFIAETAPAADGTQPGPSDRLGGSLAAVVAATLAGCHAVRVHDVFPSVQAVRVAEALAGGAR